MKFKTGDIVVSNEQVYEVYEVSLDFYLLLTVLTANGCYNLVHKKNLRIATSIEKHNFLLNKNKNN